MSFGRRHGSASRWLHRLLRCNGAVDGGGGASSHSQLPVCPGGSSEAAAPLGRRGHLRSRRASARLRRGAVAHRHRQYRCLLLRGSSDTAVCRRRATEAPAATATVYIDIECSATHDHQHAELARQRCTYGAAGAAAVFRRAAPSAPGGGWPHGAGRRSGRAASRGGPAAAARRTTRRAGARPRCDAAACTDACVHCSSEASVSVGRAAHLTHRRRRSQAPMTGRSHSCALSWLRRARLVPTTPCQALRLPPSTGRKAVQRQAAPTMVARAPRSRAQSAPHRHRSSPTSPPTCP